MNARAFLFLAGFYHIDVKYTHKNNISEDSIAQQVSTIFGSFGSGDLILANHVSYFDLIYLLFRFSPTFATIVYENGVAKVVRQNFLSAFLTCIFNLTPMTSDKGDKLTNIMKYARDNGAGPVVVFPEGTTTNGKGILRFVAGIFPDDFDNFLKKENLSVHLVGFHYEATPINPAYHIEGFYRHFYQIATQFRNKMTVTIVNLDDEAQSDNFGTFRQLLERSTGAKIIMSGIKDKISFLEYWNTTQGDYVKKLE